MVPTNIIVVGFWWLLHVMRHVVLSLCLWKGTTLDDHGLLVLEDCSSWEPNTVWLNAMLPWPKCFSRH
jgi:hypothetical protein